MAYSLQLLTTRPQCDNVLAFATDKRATLVFRDTEGDFRTGNTSKTATDLAAELSSLNAYITAMTPVVSGLPEGRERTEQLDLLRKKTDRRDNVLSLQGRVGGEKLVLRELEQALLDPQVPILDDFIAQVTAHRLTLPA